MTSRPDRYRALLTELSRARASADGQLPMKDEFRYIEAMDALWYAMTPAERADVERTLRSA